VANGRVSKKNLRLQVHACVCGRSAKSVWIGHQIWVLGSGRRQRPPEDLAKRHPATSREFAPTPTRMPAPLICRYTDTPTYIGPEPELPPRSANTPYILIFYVLHVGVPIIPFNGQTTSNHTKLSTPSRSPLLDFGVHTHTGGYVGSSRRTASDHQALPRPSTAF
jgi:hypothetical protein